MVKENFKTAFAEKKIHLEKKTGLTAENVYESTN